MHAVQDIMGDSILPWDSINLVPVGLALMLLSVLITAIIALFLTLFFGRIFARISNRIPYRKLVISVIIFIVVMMFLLAGPLGLFIGAIATCIGLLPPMLGLSRVHLMGSLMFPIILFFLGLDTVILGFLGLI